MERIANKVESFLRTSEGDFDSLALELYAYQFENNKPYQAYNRSLGMSPSHVRRWQDIPAVPVTAFRSTELATFPAARASAIFESSRTSGQNPSRHYLKDLGLYETALKASFSKWMLPDAAHMPFFILTPAPGEAPRSSLSWMMDVVKRKWGAEGSQYFLKRGRLDELGLLAALNKAQLSGNPVALMGTTIAFLTFFDFLTKSGKAYQLPDGSRLFDTGGMKTTKRDISRTDFTSLAQSQLGIPESWCVNEYGMCEMSSQFYGKGSNTALEGPAWVRTLVIDPATGEEAKKGQEGLLRHYDLANVDSVMAIQTEDVGRAEDHGFTLLGRAKDADLKGCSLSAELLLA